MPDCIDIEDFLSKYTFLLALKCLHDNYLAITPPVYFVRFIDHLINYLKNREDNDLFQMETLISNNINGFSLSNIDYNDLQYCAKIQMRIFWDTDFRKKKWIVEVKKVKEKEKKRIEEINEETKTENPNQLCEPDNLEDLSIWDNLIPKTDTSLIIDLLKDFKESYILKILFEEDKFQPQVKKWLLSQLKNLFDLSLKRSKKTVNFIAETNSFLIKLISEEITKPDQNQIDAFTNLVHSNVVTKGFGKINLNFDNAKPCYDQVYFASLPDDIAGVKFLEEISLLIQNIIILRN
ncbi:unnamed protein product [Blepharisma stoltei]|uniref:Uncharacterized protein n=1 Tax=Blepharisma stoltei TaxID=1481888 RepID=A0AAU9K2G2_9CILI|nr:unnamed protein product [Blepharisma stoltei]